MFRKISRLRPEDVELTQQKLGMVSRDQKQVSVEEQSLESRKLANARQKKAYSGAIADLCRREMNDECRRKIEHLYTDDDVDLRDGNLLIELLKVMSEDEVPVKTSRGNIPEAEKFKKLVRIQTALEFLQQCDDVKLENIRPVDIEEGKEKETLALLWALMQYWIIMIEIKNQKEQPPGSNCQALEVDHQEQTSQGPPKVKNATQTLLQWCQKTTQGYSGVKVTDFTTSWKDGLAFSALIHKHRSDLIDFESLEVEDTAYNLNNAFDVAEKELGIPKLLDAEDMVFPDKRSIVVYISLYYSFFCLKHHEPPPSPVVPVFVPTPDPPPVERVQHQKSGNETQACTGAEESGTQTTPLVPISVSTPDPPLVERAQCQEAGNETQASTGAGKSGIPTAPVAPTALPRPDQKMGSAETQQLANKPHGIQTQASTGTGKPGTQTTQPPTQPGPSPPPYSPPKYPPYPAYQQPYQQPYYQRPSQQPYYQQPYQRPYYQQPYQQQPYRPAYYQQPRAAPPMQMMQQQTIQVDTGLGMLTVGAQQGAGGMQSSFMQLGSTTVGAAPRAQPVQPTAKPTAYAPTKNKGKKSKK